MGKPEIFMGDPNVIRPNGVARVELPGLVVLVPLMDYDSPTDAVVGQAVLTIGGLDRAITDLLTILSTLVPREDPIIVRPPELQAAIDRMYKMIDAHAEARAKMAAARAIAETGARPTGA